MRGRKPLLTYKDCENIRNEYLLSFPKVRKKDIAQKYAVSVPTISRVLNGSYNAGINIWGDRLPNDELDCGKSSYPALTKDECENIKKDYEFGGWNQRELSEIYEVSQGTISRVLNGKYRPISDEEREKLGTLY